MCSVTPSCVLFHSFYFILVIFARDFAGWQRLHRPFLYHQCALQMGQAKLQEPSLVLRQPLHTELGCRIGEGWAPPVWQGTASGAIPCSSTALALASRAEPEVNVQAEDRSICFSRCQEASPTKLRSLHPARSYPVLPVRSSLLWMAAGT